METHTRLTSQRRCGCIQPSMSVVSSVIVSHDEPSAISIQQPISLLRVTKRLDTARQLPRLLNQNESKNVIDRHPSECCNATSQRLQRAQSTRVQLQTLFPSSSSRDSRSLERPSSYVRQGSSKRESKSQNRCLTLSHPTRELLTLLRRRSVRHSATLASRRHKRTSSKSVEAAGVICDADSSRLRCSDRLNTSLKSANPLPKRGPNRASTARNWVLQ
jgi:hypothetical protein